MEAPQTAGDGVSGSRKPLSFVAVMPGPRNGMTLMTEVISDALRDQYDVRMFDVGAPFEKPGRKWLILKALWSFFSAVRILFWPKRRGERLYLVLNSHGGLVYNLWQAAAGRLRGFPMVVHHHVWSYLSDHDWRMRWLLRVLGDDTVHAVHCPVMSDELQSTYGRKLRFAYVTPGIVGIPEFETSDRPPSETFVIGMLANLTIEKGVGEAIDTLLRLLEQGRNVKLLLGGPLASAEARERVEQAVADHREHIEHIGPVYGADKEAFFAQLDAFVFPTQYRNESWGIVLNEALMAGVPVITYQRGCTAYLVGDDGGLVVQNRGQFVAAASEQISRWMTIGQATWQLVKAPSIAGANFAIKRRRNLRASAKASRPTTGPPRTKV